MIITSLLDTDFYKFSIQKAIIDTYGRGIEAEYEFTCRNKIFFTPEMVSEIKKEIIGLGQLNISFDERLFLITKCDMLQGTYTDFLTYFQLQPENDVSVIYPDDSKKLEIKIKGPWYRVMFYETFILSIINEVYAHALPLHESYLEDGRKDLKKKIITLGAYTREFKIMEFGTRRRFSKDWQREVYQALTNDDRSKGNIVGTSNVLLAYHQGTTPLGTQAHEWFMGTQAFEPVQKSQISSLLKWNEIYRDKLTTALTDTFGNEKFVKDLYACPHLMDIYSGFRHDSGDPISWGFMMLNVLEKHNIDPKRKTLVFSDSLNIDRAFQIFATFKDKINVVFGIGTDLTFSPNMGPIVPQNVIKMTRCNGQPVCKLSANPEKAMCKDQVYLDYVRHAIKEY
jgi:nicotinate phosphoribosyltransferase